MKRHLGCIVGVLAAGLLCSAARASVSAFLTSTNGGGAAWDYTLRFVPSVDGETLAAGDFVTIYDYAPILMIITEVATAWTGSVQTLGMTPPGLLGAAGLADGPTLSNITFTYTGPTLTGPMDFAAVIITTSPASHAFVSDGAGQSTAASGKADTLFPVSVPVWACCTSPEPGSLVLACVAGLGLAVRRRRVMGDF